MLPLESDYSICRFEKTYHSSFDAPLFFFLFFLSLTSNPLAPFNFILFLSLILNPLAPFKFFVFL